MIALAFVSICEDMRVLVKRTVNSDDGASE